MDLTIMIGWPLRNNWRQMVWHWSPNWVWPLGVRFMGIWHHGTFLLSPMQAWGVSNHARWPIWARCKPIWRDACILQCPTHFGSCTRQYRITRSWWTSEANSPKMKPQFSSHKSKIIKFKTHLLHINLLSQNLPSLLHYTAEQATIVNL
jgi:hypothetical protein